MDQPPMDYFGQGITRNPSQGQGPSDPPSHPPPNPWIATSPHPHIAPQHHWSPHPSPPPVPQFFPMHRARHPASHPFIAHGGGLPPPDPSVRAFPPPEPLQMPMHGRPWVHQFPQAPSPPANVQPSPLNMNGTAADYPYGHPDPSAASRGLPYQSAGEMGMGLAPLSSATPEAHIPGRPLYPQHPEQHPANHLVMPPLMPPYSPPTYIHQYSPHSPHLSHLNHRSSLSPAAAGPRMARPVMPHPTLYPPVPYHEIPPPPSSNNDRRRLAPTRIRRSGHQRLPSTDLPGAREGEDDASHGPRVHSSGRSGHRHSQTLNFSAMEDATVRQLQVIRSGVTGQGRLVVSRAALSSLQSVDIKQLPEHERTCVICYNDYGVETPEGINEAPLRLPRCKHVFGDHCIKKWFEDSDSCPYCRDKLPSEPKNTVSSARVYMNMMRLRGGALPQGLTEDVYMRIMAGLPPDADGDSDNSFARPPAGPERRSLPDDTGDSQRRIRPRRDSSEDYSHSEDDEAGAYSTASSSAPVRIPSRERERERERDRERHHQWMGRSSGQRRAAQAALNQVNAADGDEISPRSST